MRGEAGNHERSSVLKRRGEVDRSIVEAGIVYHLPPSWLGVDVGNQSLLPDCYAAANVAVL